MSIPPTRRPAGNPVTNSTQRKLDELDALLQRMLDLPVVPAEEGTAAAEEPADIALAVADPPAPMPSPTSPGTGLQPPSPDGPGYVTPETSVPSEPPLPPLPRRRRPALWVRPLVWSNRAFDCCAGSLGASGQWLCGRTGRTVLGIVGLMCLAAAAALVALDWTGWIW